jgi:hypothetical protein
MAPAVEEAIGLLDPVSSAPRLDVGTGPAHEGLHGDADDGEPGPDDRQPVPAAPEP